MMTGCGFLFDHSLMPTTAVNIEISKPLVVNSGLSSYMLRHLFGFLFTTKRTDEGLGLALTLSCEMLRELGDDLLADPAPAGGERFIVLPLLPTLATASSGDNLP